MLITKNIIINPVAFPVLGKNNKVVNEISKRFTKYYKRGVKKTNRSRLLGYNLFVPKAFAKFESTFRDDLMMLEVKVNKDSSILIPSFYTSKKTFENLFELNKTKSLSDIYTFNKNSYRLNIEENVRLFKEVVPDIASAETRLGKEIKLGKADHIKSFTKTFLRNHYGDVGLANFWDALTGWDNKGYGVGKILKHTTSPMFKFFRNVTREFQGDKVFKDSKYKTLISSSNKEEMKKNTSIILRKILTGESSNIDTFIDQTISIFDRPNDISGWLKNLSDIDTSNLLAEEKEIFDAVTKMFNISLDWGEEGIPDTVRDAQNRGEEVKTLHDGKYRRTGLLRFMWKGTFRKNLNKLFKTSYFGKEFSYSVEDFDREIANKIKKYTNDLSEEDSKKVTREMAEGFVGSTVKCIQKVTVPLTIRFLMFVVVFGINPGSESIEGLLDAVENPIMQPFGIDRPSVTANSKEQRSIGYEEGYGEGYEEGASKEEALKKENDILKEKLENFEKLQNWHKGIMGLEEKNICEWLNKNKVPDLEKEKSKKFKLSHKIFTSTCEYSLNDGFSVKSDNILKSLYEKFRNNELKSISDSEKDILNDILSIYFKSNLESLNNDARLKRNVKHFLFYASSKLAKAGGENPDFSFGLASSPKKAKILGRFISDLKDDAKEMQSLMKDAEEKVLDENPNASKDEIEEKQLEAGNNSLGNKNISPEDLKEISKLTVKKFEAIGGELSDRWEKNIHKTDSRFVSIFREIQYLPLNVLISTMEIVEEKVSGDAEYSETFKRWNQDKANMNRTEALCGLMWLLLVGGYWRRSNASLGENVREVFVEIIGTTNIFKIKPVQMAIQTIQMVLWASLSEEFKEIVKSVEEEEDEENAQRSIKDASSFTPADIQNLISLLNNLDGVIAKKQKMTDGDKYVAGVKQAEAVTKKQMNIPYISFTYKKPTLNSGGSNSLEDLQLPATN